jgi:hypothetical protein
MVSWNLTYKWKRLSIVQMVEQIMIYIDKYNDIDGVNKYLQSTCPDTWDYRNSVQQWKTTTNSFTSRSIWNVMQKYYLKLIKINDAVLTQFSIWLFDVAACNKTYTTFIDSSSKMARDPEFISKIKDSELNRHLYKILLHNTIPAEKTRIYERILMTDTISDELADDILFQKADITYGMVEGSAHNLKCEYFVHAFFCANMTENLDKRNANRIISAICSTTVDSDKKFKFFTEVLEKTEIKVKIDHKVFESALNSMKRNLSNGSQILTQFLHNMDKLNENRVRPAFFLNRKNFLILMRMVETVQGSKYSFEKALNGFVLTQLEIRKAHNKPDIVSGYELIKLYHECKYQKFPFPIKIVITMEEFEKICELKPDVRIMKDAYKCLDGIKSPTAKCMEAVTVHKSCDSAVKFLLSVGTLVSARCIKNVIKHYKSDIMDDFKIIFKEVIEAQRKKELNERFEYKTDTKVTVISKDGDQIQNGADIRDQKVSYVLSF